MADKNSNMSVLTVHTEFLITRRPKPNWLTETIEVTSIGVTDLFFWISVEYE